MLRSRDRFLSPCKAPFSHDARRLCTLRLFAALMNLPCLTPQAAWEWASAFQSAGGSCEGMTSPPKVRLPMIASAFRSF